MKAALILSGLLAVFLVRAEQEIQLGVTVLGSSESVSIENMINGWDGNYQSGEYAYADQTQYLTYKAALPNIQDAEWGRIEFSRLYRRYYYLEFSKDTADYYRALETTGTLNSDKELDLSVNHFEGAGIAIGYWLPDFEMSKGDLALGGRVTLYEPGHFQFGSLEGNVAAGDASAASTRIRYRYDQDKILSSTDGSEFAVDDVDKGVGWSVDLSAKWTFNEYQVNWQGSDIANRFEWRKGAFTDGCVNVGGGAQSVCQPVSSSGGVSGNERVSETILARHHLTVRQLNHQMDLGGMVHGRYQRYYIAKNQDSELGRFSFFLYHPVQLGVAWQYQAINIYLAADDWRFEGMRNLELNLSLGWRW